MAAAYKTPILAYGFEHQEPNNDNIAKVYSDSSIHCKLQAFVIATLMHNRLGIRKCVLKITEN